MGRITGKELVERWALTDPDDIVTLCKQGRLTAFSKLGESIDRAEQIANYEELCIKFKAIMENVLASPPADPTEKSPLDKLYEVLCRKREYALSLLTHDLIDHGNYDLQEIERLEQTIPWLKCCPKDDRQSDKPLRKEQAHRERARAIAELLWEQDPSRTIEDLCHGDEINRIACQGHIYTEKTLRNWVKDLCPNRHPGRRCKKTPADT